MKALLLAFVITNLTPILDYDRSVHLGTAKVGAQLHTDKRFGSATIIAISDRLVGAQFIRVPNAANRDSSEALIEFDTDTSIEVCIARDSRLKQIPKWLRKYALTSDVFVTSDTPYQVRCSISPPGHVTLGSNHGKKGTSMYAALLLEVKR